MPQKIHRRWPDFAARKGGKVISRRAGAKAPANIEKGSGKVEMAREELTALVATSVAG